MLRHPIRAASAAAILVLASGAPPAAEQGFRQEGEASYFRSGVGDNTETASGEPVDPGDLTAAHRTLPLGTRATVTNRETGRSVEVRINDRGPARGDRVIDLSARAASELGMERTGVAPVVVEADPARQDDPGVRREVEELATRD